VRAGALVIEQNDDLRKLLQMIDIKFAGHRVPLYRAMEEMRHASADFAEYTELRSLKGVD